MEVPVTVSATLLSLKNQNHSRERWNSIIKHHTKLKDDHAILTTYTQMTSLGIAPDNATLPLVLKACARLSAVESGKNIHSSILGTGLIGDVRVGTALVDFYCKCGLIEEARQVFDEMPVRDVVSLNALISGYVGCCYYEEAVLLFREMESENFKANSRTVVALLLACEDGLEIRLGKEIHGYCLRNGLFDLDPHVGTALIGFYLKFDVRISRLVFDLMIVRSIVSWNAMINGYVDVGNYLEALNLFLSMLENGVHFDSVTMLVVIQACAEFESLQLGMQIHQMAIKLKYVGDLFIVNALLNMYSENGSLASSCALFDTVPTCDVALWNSMISAYIDFGCYEEALSLFISMKNEGIKEDERTISIMLSTCAKFADGLRKGKSLHAHAIKCRMKMDVSLGNALLSMYAEINCVEAVQKVFAELRSLNVISWNTTILALAHSKMSSEAWQLFGVMRKSEFKPNSYTMISILATCEGETCLNVGQSIHGYVVKHGIEVNLSLNTKLTDMYMNCGDEASARTLFEFCTNRDLISWNSMIANYINDNQVHEALLLFNRMISEVEPNPVTIINVLSSCTDLANLPQGQCLHAYVIRRHSYLGFNLSLANAFVTMYARCGSMQNAKKIFDTLPRRNIISWNAMITGYRMHGRGYDAILAFLQMLEDGYQPNGVTFLSVMSACSHSGLIEKGLELFQSMIQDFNITPELAHYGCVVDLLGRGGRLDEAREFIKSMPIEPDASVWRALLSACRVNYNTKLAENIFEKLVELEPMNPGNYVLLSNIYAAAGHWLEVRQIRTWLKEKGLNKPPGISWIVVRSQVNMVESCRQFSHSEKLGFAFGLISLSVLPHIMVTKTSRLFVDCHKLSECGA
ncbi:pentatricopeptide repeat-containing protein At4g19191, mitochondrial-like [Castanea sativa]|uniref:pentatricopeptide repeat-containing protein At4g19191, mitochondrial-like n=1 Tax=Castanea sativa TaxID=21020 RepID=UPI003F652147